MNMSLVHTYEARTPIDMKTAYHVVGRTHTIVSFCMPVWGRREWNLLSHLPRKPRRRSEEKSRNTSQEEQGRPAFGSVLQRQQTQKNKPSGHLYIPEAYPAS